MYKVLKETISCTSEQQNLLNSDFGASFVPLTDDVIEKLEKLHFFVIFYITFCFQINFIFIFVDE